jgi:hypothetical protein
VGSYRGDQSHAHPHGIFRVSAHMMRRQGAAKKYAAHGAAEHANTIMQTAREVTVYLLS